MISGTAVGLASVILGDDYIKDAALTQLNEIAASAKKALDILQQEAFGEDDE